MQAALAERAALFAKAETPPVSSGFQLRSDGLRVENGSDSGFFGKVLRTGPNLAVLGPCFAALSAFGASYSGSVDAGVFYASLTKIQ
ncbi:MAG: hypothetical protein AAGK77_00285 [Pseudomonadota bacterium]